MKKVLLATCLAFTALAAAAAFSACTSEEEHVHDMTANQAVAATCTEDGNTAYYYCEGCGKYFSDEAGQTEIELSDTVVSATGHSTTLVGAVSATCTEAGNTAYYVCGNCGTYFSDEAGQTEIELSDTVVPATGHSTSLVEAVAATCTEDGNTAYYVCENCGKYFSDEEGTTEIALSDTVIAASHTLTLVEAVAATCTEAGNTAYYVCSVCGEYFSDEDAAMQIELSDTVIPATGHSTSLVEAVAATCTEDGNTAYYVCSVCGEYFSDEVGATQIELSDTVVPATGHSTSLVEAVSATCTVDGNTAYYVCGNCGEYFSDKAATTQIELSDTVIPATGHDTSLVRAVSATCTTAGSIAYYVCENCGKYFSQAAATTEITLADTIVAPVGHSLILVAAKAATCTEDGNTAYYECSACGIYFSDVTARTEITLADTVISASHSLTFVEAKEASCTEDGNIAYYECENCGKYFSDEDAATELQLSDIVIEGGHSDVSTVVYTDPTSTDDGLAYQECNVCGNAVGSIITLPALSDENVENGTYDYSVTYEYRAQGTTIYFDRIGVYTFADTTYDIPDFYVALGTSIQASSTYIYDLSAGATIAVSRLTVNSSLDEAKYGIFLNNATAGTYKLTITTTFDHVATLIGTDGTSIDLITTSDTLEAKFHIDDGVYYMIVFHSGTSLSASFYIETSEDTTLSPEQSYELETLDARGGYVEVVVADEVAEGTYRLTISGGVSLGRYYNFTITVNGVDYYVALDEYVGENISVSTTVELKGGDVITITNNNLIGMSGLTLGMTEVVD